MDGFTTPGIDDFNFGGLWGVSWLNKPMIQLIVSVILVAAVWVWAARKLSVKPTKRQWTFEFLYDYIRNSVGRDIIGHNYQRWTPLLLAIFFLVIVNNIFGEFFYFMFPTFSNIGYVYGLVIVVYITFIVAGIKAHGPGYFRLATVPSGVPKWLYPIIIPLEILSTFIVRPVTLSVRLFANMFAGHMSVLVFITGGAYLLTYAHNALYNVSGVLSLVLGMAIIALELFIGYLQAYVFTVLTAQYIASSLDGGH
jgi:F-type H+-transporting ATPase subunit a